MRRPIAFCLQAALPALLLALAGCSTVEMNRPLDNPPDSLTPAGTITPDGYRLTGIAPNEQSPEILLAIAMSGGGKRSAAFSYGILQGLRDFPITVGGQETNLLEQVDIISSVSGGSFTAAYYGLHRDEIFETYEDAFLRQNTQGRIVGLYLLPWNWEWLVNPRFGTNDAMAEIYDDAMFGGATYADLAGNGLPLININATDITSGAVFSFNQEHFDLLCSDLMSFPLARAVAASNGFPVVFTPITVRSHARECAGLRPSWMDEALTDRSEISRRRYLAETLQDYLDPEATRFVHLMDGGIADNLAMRGMLDAIVLFGGDDERVQRSGLLRARRIVMISADGQGAIDYSWRRQRTVTGIGQILSLVSGTQIDRYNFETLLLARETLSDLAERVSELRCAQAPVIDGHACDDVETHFIHLSLRNITDDAVRAELEAIPTALNLSDEHVDLLVTQARQVVGESRQLQRLRDGLAPAEADMADAGQ
jgi:NTE family protein